MKSISVAALAPLVWNASAEPGMRTVIGTKYFALASRK